MKLLLLLFAFQGMLRGDSDWYTLESKHFKLSYPKNYTVVARQSIQDLENIHKILTRYLNNIPEKTRVVVSPVLEDANGFARVLPYPLIHIYPFPPGADEGLGHYKSWLYQLLLHEYVHIVHLTTMGPIHKTINNIFGNNVAPNHLLPKWIIEGLAVYYESYLTGFGRLGAPYYEMLFRTSILNHNISLGELSNVTEHYPYGGVPYLYGAYLMGYIFKDLPLKKTGDFTNQYGDQLIPYRINGAFRAAGVGDMEVNYRNFKKDYSQKYQKLKKEVIDRGITPFKPVFSGKNTPRMFHLSEPQNGVVIGYSGGEHHTGTLHYIQSDGVEKMGGFSGLGPVEQFGIDQLFTRFTRRGNRTSRGLFKRRGRKEEKLFDDLSVVHIAVTPRGIFLVVNEYGDETLWWYDPFEGDRKRIYQSSGLNTIGKPVLVGDDLIFSMNSSGGFWDLYRYNLKNQKITQLTSDLFTDLSPCYNPEDQLIYFISNRWRNILNIHSYDLKSGVIRRRSNFLNGVVQLVCDQKQLYARRYRPDDGFEGIAIQYSDLIDEAVPRNRIDHPFRVVTGEEPVSYSKQPFSVFPEILPQRIKPELQTANFQNYLMIDLSGGDVRDQITYQAILGYDFEVADLFGSFYLSDFSHLMSYTLGYSYTTFNIPEYPVANDLEGTLGGSNHSFVATTGYTLFHGSRYGYLYLSGGYQFSHYRLPDIPPHPDRMRIGEIDDHESASMAFGFFYGDFHILKATPGFARGSGINIRFSLTERDLYSDYNTISGAIQYRHYLPFSSINSAFAFNYNLSLGYTKGGFSRRYLGGYPETDDWVQSMIDRTVIAGAYLRGYPPSRFSGKMSQLFNFEYRQHLFYLAGGYATLPFYLHRIYARAFYDVALIDPDKLYTFEPKQGLGAELSFQFYIGYLEQYTLSLGYSYGINEGGGHRYYLNFTSLY